MNRYRRRTWIACLVVAGTLGLTTNAQRLPAQAPVYNELNREAAIQEVERSIRIVETQIDETSQSVEKLANRTDKHKQTLDDIVNQLAGLQSPQKDDPPPPKKPNPKQVAGRVPMTHLSDKKETIVFIVENNRVTFLDINKAMDSLVQKIKGEISPGRSNYQGTHVVPFGHFDIKYDITIVLNQVIPDFEIVRKPGHPGESQEEFNLPSSESRRIIESTNPNTHTVQFAVWSDSFEIFRSVRAAAAQREFETGFLPMEPGEPVRVGGGKARVN